MSSIKYRHLGRKSSHRQALLRNLVTSLFEKESISTTWAKAKEAQRLAEKLITLGKRNTEAARQKAQAIFYVRTPSALILILCPFEFVVYRPKLTILTRNHTDISQSSSMSSASATPTGLAATHALYESSQ